MDLARVSEFNLNVKEENVMKTETSAADYIIYFLFFLHPFRDNFSNFEKFQSLPSSKKLHLLQKKVFYGISLGFITGIFFVGFVYYSTKIYVFLFLPIFLFILYKISKKMLSFEKDLLEKQE